MSTSASQVDRLDLRYLSNSRRHERKCWCHKYNMCGRGVGHKETASVAELFNTAALQQQFGVHWPWRCAESVVCAYPKTCWKHISGLEKCCHSSLRVYPRTNGRRRPKLGDTPGPSDWNLRGAKQVKQTIRSVSIESDACGWRPFSRGCE